MNFDQPNATKDDVAKKVLEAKKEESSRQPFSMGSLVGDLEKDLDATASVEKSVADLKEQKIREELKPLLDKLIESSKTLEDSSDFEQGKEKYLIIKGDGQSWKDIVSKRFAAMLERAGMRDELIKAYESKGGAIKVERGDSGNVYNLSEIFPEAGIGNVSRENLEYMMKNSPNFDIESHLKKQLEDVATGTISVESFLQDMKDQGGERKFPMLEGFGFTALEAGDGAVAGKTFAVIENLGSLRPEIGQKIQGTLETFTNQQKKAFVDAYKKEKERGAAAKKN